MPGTTEEAAAAQPVVAPLTSAALILVATIEPGGEPAVREALPDLAALARSIGFRFPGSGLACVTGFGSDAWGRLRSRDRVPPRSIPSRNCAGPATTPPPPRATCCSTSGPSGWTCATSGPPSCSAGSAVR